MIWDSTYLVTVKLKIISLYSESNTRNQSDFHYNKTVISHKSFNHCKEMKLYSKWLLNYFSARSTTNNKIKTWITKLNSKGKSDATLKNGKILFSHEKKTNHDVQIIHYLYIIINMDVLKYYSFQFLNNVL